MGCYPCHRHGACGNNSSKHCPCHGQWQCGAYATIPPQTESFYSDPIAFKVSNQDDLAVSLYVKGADNPGEYGAT